MRFEAGAALPEFRSERFLRAHIAATMAFYHPRAIDPRGGFFHYFRDDGTVYDTRHRHLVSSTRFVFNYALAAGEFANDAALARDYRDAARHGLAFLRERHRDAASGGYAWTLRDGAPEDRTQHAYGAAFVLLAYACACRAGLEEARPWMEETWALLEARYWDADAGLYRDEADPAWHFSDYRGQNSNMHLCEALLAAHQASGAPRYLERALTLADHVTRRLAVKAGGLVWEHYDRDWNLDLDYHREEPRHLFRPRGFQVGHQTEWTKLLLTLAERLQSAPAAQPGAPAAQPGAPAARPSTPTARSAARGRSAGLAPAARPGAVRCRRGARLGRRVRRALLRLRTRRAGVRYGQVLLGAGGIARRGGAARGGHGGRALLGVVPAAVELRVAAFRRPPLRRLVSHPRPLQRQVRRRKEPGRQDRLPHHGGPATRCCICCAAHTEARRRRRRWPQRALPLLVLLVPLLVLLLPAATVRAASAAAAPLAPVDAAQAARLAASVRTEFLHAWNGYRRYAWGHDELRPLSRTARDWYGEPLLMTPIDALDTLVLMGLPAEAAEARELIATQLSFDRDIDVKHFEIVIRLLGGLLSAYELTHDARLLALAADLGRRLSPAFDSPTGLPWVYVNLRTGRTRGSETAARPIPPRVRSCPSTARSRSSPASARSTTRRCAP